ncbi:hypothetical protein [Angustibacter luteus]|uniref:DUF2750 domain-containing protein n=1 Tax=Angustibacter luteus TaxID=658456 RepID=A0ABW1JDP8_9ACTN
MSTPDDAADAPLLDALRQRDLVFVRTQDQRSVVVEHEGRRVLVACTDRAILADWWVQHAGPDAEAPSIAELPFRQLVGLWAAPDVDLLIDPDAGGGVVVPVGAARRHLGLGPVVAGRVGAGEGSAEPLPFVGFSGGRTGIRVPLVLLLSCVLLILIGLGSGSLWLLLVAVLGIGAAIALGHRAFGELRQARRATARLAESERLLKQERPGP